MVGIDAALIVVSYYGAFFARFDGTIPGRYAAMFLSTLPWMVLIHIVTALAGRLHQGVWRYVSLWDCLRLAATTAAGTILFFGFTSVVLGSHVPYSIYLIDMLLLIALRSGVRAARRVIHDLESPTRGKRILLFGAGDAGEMIVRDMRHNGYYGYTPIGFIDDDPVKVGRRVHGVPVLGSRHDLARVMGTIKPEEVLIAMPQASSSTIRGIMKALEPYPLPVKLLPSLRDLIKGTVTVANIRNIALEDLLARKPAGLDIKHIRNLIEGRRVMVTGAGGSIGSELCRQILALKPNLLLAFERHENSLFAISQGLAASDSCRALRSIIGDVTDVRRVNDLFDRYRPEMVFHAAAHKHVPLMEFNPSEAVKNNVGGTRIVAEAAVRFGVKRFVFISSDKAVKPTSVMGATKHVGELLIRSIENSGAGLFAAVRFGNVLGSNGSVVPLFREQIRSGGPVTVTHPEMRRFFMLIPEAAQLVLHAATISEHGAIYVLEMGEQIRISEMARRLIQLSGYVPDREIPIQYIGLRPGEKLFEELLEDDEIAEPSSVAEILRLSNRGKLDRNWLARQIEQLESSAARADDESVLRDLHVLVPSFQVASFQGDQAQEAGCRESV